MRHSASCVERAQRLAAATSFVDAAAVTCALARELGAHGAMVLLHTASGPPGLAIDSLAELSDERRLYTLSRQHWLENPIFELLRKRPGVIGREALDGRAFGELCWQDRPPGARCHVFVAPLIGPQGWFGTIVFVCRTPPALELERKLSLLATHLSVWCTDRGIGVLPEIPGPQLARRQHQIARLAASGRTNGEIAEQLGISINTVKVRLKQVFDRLAVNNRTELANVLRPLSPFDGLPEGVTHAKTVTVTRAATVPQAYAPTHERARQGESSRRRR